MGLDGVEIVMELEDEFGITISDDEASRLQSVSEVVDCVYRRCDHRPRVSCVSAHTFYRLRRALVDLAGVGRRQVRTESALATLKRPKNSAIAMYKNATGAGTGPQ